MIGDSPVFRDPDDNFTIRGTVFIGTEGLWHLLKRKNVNTEIVNKAYLKTYKKILIFTNADLNIYQPGDNINITCGKKFYHLIAPLFGKPKGRVIESALRREWKKNYKKCLLLRIADYIMTPPDRRLLDPAEASVRDDGRSENER